MTKMLIALLLGLLCVLASADDSGAISKRGLFVVSYQSELQPLQINQLHAWVLHVEDSQGNAISGAEIEVDGGMPEHDHGLATKPRVTRELGNGDYRLAGLRFHMGGNWELLLTIKADGKTDSVVLKVTL